MAVHVRRIYELIKILEILSLIVVIILMKISLRINSYVWIDSLLVEREGNSLGKELKILCIVLVVCRLYMDIPLAIIR